MCIYVYICTSHHNIRISNSRYDIYIFFITKTCFSISISEFSFRSRVDLDLDLDFDVDYEYEYEYIQASNIISTIYV